MRLLVKNMLCSKPHCQKSFEVILFSYKSSDFCGPTVGTPPFLKSTEDFFEMFHSLLMSQWAVLFEGIPTEFVAGELTDSRG